MQNFAKMQNYQRGTMFRKFVLNRWFGKSAFCDVVKGGDIELASLLEK